MPFLLRPTDGRWWLWLKWSISMNESVFPKTLSARATGREILWTRSRLSVCLAVFPAIHGIPDPLKSPRRCKRRRLCCTDVQENLWNCRKSGKDACSFQIYHRFGAGLQVGEIGYDRHDGHHITERRRPPPLRRDRAYSPRTQGVYSMAHAGVISCGNVCRPPVKGQPSKGEHRHVSWCHALAAIVER